MMKVCFYQNLEVKSHRKYIHALATKMWGGNYKIFCWSTLCFFPPWTYYHLEEALQIIYKWSSEWSSPEYEALLKTQIWDSKGNLVNDRILEIDIPLKSIQNKGRNQGKNENFVRGTWQNENSLQKKPLTCFLS